MERKNNYRHLMPLLAFVIVGLLLTLSYGIKNDVSFFFVNMLETAVVFFLVASIFLRRLALPLFNLRSDSLLIGTALITYGISSSPWFLWMLLVPLTDIVMYSGNNSVDTKPMKSSFDTIEFCVLLVATIAVVVIVLTKMPSSNILAVIGGAVIMLLLRLYVMLKGNVAENRYPWMMSVVLIPCIILMYQYLSESGMLLVYLAFGVSLIFGLLDMAKHKSVYGITKK